MTFKEWIKTSKYKNQEPLSVKYLICNMLYLTDLKGIEEFKNLEYLNCSHNNIKSLKYVEKLTNLKILDCNVNNLEHKCYHFYKFKNVKKYQQYLKSFYRKDKIKNIID